MEDKTAEIPSLKKFTSDNKKSSSDKRRSAQNSEKKTSSGSRQSAQRKPSSASAQNRRKTSAQNGANTQKRTRQPGNGAVSKKSNTAPAPRTYARQRQDVSEAIARTQVVNTKGEYPRSKPSDRANNEPVSDPLRRPASSSQRARKEPERTPRRSNEPMRTQPRRPVSERSYNDSNQRRSAGGSSSENVRKPASKNQKRSISPRARKFRMAVINIALCLCVVIIGAILSLTVLFKTESITVSGNGNIPKNDIIAASGLTLGENIFTAPKGRAAEKLEKIYPYIQQAEIKSVFPNGISIEITMADPACVIEGLGGYYIVSDEGKVLEVASTTDEIQVPVIEGVNVGGRVAGEFVEYGSAVVGDSLKEMFTIFDDLGCTEVTAINIATENEAVEIKYVHDNRIVVYIGIPEHITYKIRTAHTIIKDEIDTGGNMIAGELDVSMCYDSMKSYFNQYTLLSPNSAHATQPATEEQYEEPVTQEYYY